MIRQKLWFDRTFDKAGEAGSFPGILERLAGTPLRLRHKIEQIPADRQTQSWEGKWTIRENAGHLADLEPLWIRRFHDLIEEREVLTPADLSNQKTHQAGHNQKTTEQILDEFERLRQELLDLLGQLTSEDLDKSSLHPRLKTPMTIMDLAYFIAEHDDHHLAQITFLHQTLPN